jgi:hypothetical protein
MHKTVLRHLIPVIIAMTTFSNASTNTQTAAQEPTSSATGNDPRRDMITALPALSPHSSLGDQARVFDRFVGTWDCDYVHYEKDGSVKRYPGEVIFGWIIDGRALQDIWIWYEKGRSTNDRGIGTTLRIFDPKSGRWRIVWVSPAAGIIKILTGGGVGDRIVLEGKADDGSSLRWSFNDIRNDSFVWRGETSSDEGKTWRLTAEYHMRRRSPTATK